jgi:NAD(P)-dependent dehydrogenase (short-subunit alcohol dehydrogenase family)
MKEYAGKTALVTGAARGIGLAIARRLAEEGALVIVADVDVQKGIRAVEGLRACSLAAEFVPTDLSLPGGGGKLVAAASLFTGNLDLLVNNARAGTRLALFDETEENWDQTAAVGLKAAFFAAQATIRLMAERGGCRIVNVASVAAIQATLESASYHASKAGILQLTKYLAVAGGPFRANVNCVVPGLIVQEEHRERFNSEGNSAYRATAIAYQPLGEVGAERDVAEAVLYLCSTRARYVSGVCLTLDGAATAQEPFGLLLQQLQRT